MAEKHAPFSPSTSSGWLNCPMFYWVNKGRKEESSKYADEGTDAHKLSEVLIENPNYDVSNFQSPYLCEEFVENVEVYTEYIREILKSCKGHKVESKLKVNDDCWGTVDFVGVAPPVLHVADLKFGAGVEVFAVKNTQILIYAYACLITMVPKVREQIKRVDMHIIQPRIPGKKPETWSVPPSSIEKWGREVLIPTIERIKAKQDLEYNPGEKQCRWCAGCPKFGEYAHEQAGVEFQSHALVETERKPLPPVSKMDNSQLAHIYKNWDLFKMWISKYESALKEEMLNRMTKGEKLPGLKPVRGVTHRKWSNPVKVEAILKKLLKEKAFTKKLASPSQAEKLLKGDNKKYWEKLVSTGLVEKPEGPIVIVTSDSPKQEVDLDPAAEFKDHIEKN